MTDSVKICELLESGAALMTRFLTLLLIHSLAVLASAQDKSNYPPQMDGAITKVYKTVSETELNIYIYHPKTHEGNESRPAIIFFFGGGWKGGSPSQFKQHCKYLAARGMIAMTADYRVRSRQGTLVKECVADAKSAIRWVRTHARELGVDPDRIIAGGGSAGGHLAAATATVEGFEEKGEDLKISSRPNGLALFNPAVVLSPIPEFEMTKEKEADLAERMGVPTKELSPFHGLGKDRKLPPTILFHGMQDETVPFVTVKAFVETAKEYGALAYLAGYEGEGHGFFNFGRKKNKMYRSTMLKLDRFLVDHGLLEGPSPIEVTIIK